MARVAEGQPQARPTTGSTAKTNGATPSAMAPANEHMRHWAAMSRPPRTALKEIKGGRLKGFTDVNPQWRYQAMTEQFGPVGVGWRYTIDRLWTEPGCNGEVLAFAQVSVYTRKTIGDQGSFSESQPIIGIGGNHLIVKESAGLRSNDECWKMAVTDALSVALKMLGVAADIYAGLWDGSKYVAQDTAAANGNGQARTQQQTKAPEGFDDWLADLEATADEGTDALQAAWKKSQPFYRKYLTDTQNPKWEALKGKAAKVRVAVNA
jgi:hypothetical protein